MIPRTTRKQVGLMSAACADWDNQRQVRMQEYSRRKKLGCYSCDIYRDHEADKSYCFDCEGRGKREDK